MKLLLTLVCFLEVLKWGRRSPLSESAVGFKSRGPGMIGTPLGYPDPNLEGAAKDPGERGTGERRFRACSCRCRSLKKAWSSADDDCRVKQEDGSGGSHQEDEVVLTYENLTFAVNHACIAKILKYALRNPTAIQNDSSVENVLQTLNMTVNTGLPQPMEAEEFIKKHMEKYLRNGSFSLKEITRREDLEDVILEIFKNVKSVNLTTKNVSPFVKRIHPYFDNDPQKKPSPLEFPKNRIVKVSTRKRNSETGMHQKLGGRGYFGNENIPQSINFSEPEPKQSSGSHYLPTLERMLKGRYLPNEQSPPKGGTRYGYRFQEAYRINATCTSDLLDVLIYFETLFQGSVYAKDYPGEDDGCVFSKHGDQRSELHIVLYKGSCGVKEVHLPTMSFLEVSIVVQHFLVIGPWDNVDVIKCQFSDNLQAQAANVPVKPWSQISLNTHLFGNDIGASLEMKVGTWSSSLMYDYLEVGEHSMLSIWMNETDSPLDMQIYNCLAHSGDYSKTMWISDYRGCIVNPLFSPKIHRLRKVHGDPVNMDYLIFQAFRFPDTLSVTFQCEVRLCRHTCKESCDASSQELSRGYHVEEADNYISQEGSSSYSNSHHGNYTRGPDSNGMDFDSGHYRESYLHSLHSLDDYAEVGKPYVPPFVELYNVSRVPAPYDAYDDSDHPLHSSPHHIYTGGLVKHPGGVWPGSEYFPYASSPDSSSMERQEGREEALLRHAMEDFSAGSHSDEESPIHSLSKEEVEAGKEEIHFPDTLDSSGKFSLAPRGLHEQEEEEEEPPHIASLQNQDGPSMPASFLHHDFSFLTLKSTHGAAIDPEKAEQSAAKVPTRLDGETSLSDAQGRGAPHGGAEKGRRNSQKMG